MAVESFEVFAPRLSVFLMTLLGLGMSALSALPLWLAWTGQEEGWLMLPIGGIGLLLFGLATLIGISRIWSRRPVLWVDDEGIHVWRYPTLLWAEFERAEAARMSGEVMLVLHSRDDDAFRARMVWYRRLWAKGNAALIPGAVYLSQRLLSGSAEGVAQRINRARG